MRRAVRVLSGFAPLWCEAIVMAFKAKGEMEAASSRQRG